jgi:hypothetical protein
VLVDTSTGARFLDKDEPLYRRPRCPTRSGSSSSARESSARRRPARDRVLPDGYAEPALIYLDDGAGGTFTIVIEPATTTPRVFDRRVEPRELLSR